MRRGSTALLAGLAVLLLPAAAHAAPVSVAHAGWTWGSPLPQGDNLSSIAFLGSRGYAVGEFGTMLRTDDAGATWSGVPTGLTEDLDLVRMISPDSVVIAGGCPVRRSDDGGKTFRRLPWTASDARCTAGVASLSFPSPTVGYLLLGNGNVLRSSDSGKTWSRRTAVPGTPATSEASRIAPSDIQFTSTDTGFASTTGGDVYYTTDSGSTWTPVLQLPFAVRDLEFPSASVGYAVGAAPAVLKTTDGGATWHELGLPEATPEVARISCSGTETCLAVTVDGDRLLRTTDGGLNWTRVNPTSKKLAAVGLASATRAVAVGEAGTTVASDDAGRTFATLGGDLPGTFTGVKAQSDRGAHPFGGGGAPGRTIDRGAPGAGSAAAPP